MIKKRKIDIIFFIIFIIISIISAFYSFKQKYIIDYEPLPPDSVYKKEVTK